PKRFVSVESFPTEVELVGMSKEQQSKKDREHNAFLSATVSTDGCQESYALNSVFQVVKVYVDTLSESSFVKRSFVL
ncbi:hypothetical protein STEG23_017728, partial [Scotinomys teguina]